MTESQHRLPRSVLPRRYQVLIDTDLDTQTFRGTVGIDADAVEPTSQIVMSCVGLDITALVVGRRGAPIDCRWHLDDDAERLIIDVDDTIEADEVRIDIEFTGRLDPQLEGFYPSTYSDDDGDHTIAVTQFEAPFARKAFPCWDEPDFKAVFEISMICDDDHLAVSNSAPLAETHIDGRRRVDFAPTMVMSTYLVAWIVGAMEASPAVMAGDTPIRVIARPGQGHLTAFALECATHALGWFEAYYGIAYPGDKIDLVAIPDFAFGAMENLGCVTFRESLLLIDPTKASTSELERAATVIEHELAHMWFGDLVTMSWWNGIWLNEAFATFMEMAAADDFRPEWDIWTSFGSTKTQAYDTDALMATRPIEYPVLTPRDAEGMFDILTYEKGASILRMFEQWMGPDQFRAGVSEYLHEHSYSNTETDDLWKALGRHSDVDLTSAMESWIYVGGHPVITVSSTDTGVRLHQSPFTYLDTSDDDRSWSVPAKVRASVDGEIVEASGLLDSDHLDLVLGGAPEWVVANVDASGFYRTQVPSALRAAPSHLSAAERLDALDSTAALVLARRVAPVELIDLTREFAAVADEPSVWRKINEIVFWLARVGGSEAVDAVRGLAMELVGDSMPSLEGIEVGPTAETRAVKMRLAGTLGADPSVIAAARRILDDDDADPELAAAAPDIVATHGDRGDFEACLARYREAATPQNELRALGALGRFPSVALIEEFCDLCLAEVRTQNAPYALAATMANPVAGSTAWRFVADNWDRVNDTFPSGSIIRMVGGMRSLGDPAVIAEARQFFATHDVPQATATLAQHLEHLDVNLAAISAYRHLIADAIAS